MEGYGICKACKRMNKKMEQIHVDLTGYTAVVTGGRIKIGFATALRLLRDGAKVIVITRYPYDALDRYKKEVDYERFKDNLIIYGFNLMQVNKLDKLIQFIKTQFPEGLDFLINNAAQTIKKANSYYQELEQNPEEVISIANSAFGNCSSLKSVTISDGIETIGYGVFSYCNSLESVEIPKSVTFIGYDAFKCCNNLTTIKVDEKNSKYDSRDNCNAIIETEKNVLVEGCKNTIIPNSVAVIGKHAFESCEGLTEITIPEGVTSIESNAFSYCSNLRSITFPDSMKKLDTVIFKDCISLMDVTISAGVKEIYSRTFEGCTSLEHVMVDEENSKYDSRNDCNAIIETETNSLLLGCKNTIIPDGVTAISTGAFVNCKDLTEITIPNSVVEIETSAFGRCTGLTEVVIPNSVTHIGFYAFSDCENLTSIVISDNVEHMGMFTLEGCKNLTSITWKGTTYGSVEEFESAFVKGGGSIHC